MLGVLFNRDTPRQDVAIAGDPDQPVDIRRAAYARLADSGLAAQPVYLDFFRATLLDPDTDPTIAVTCALALARHGSPGDAIHITELLGSPEPYARWQAAACLQRLHDPATVPALIRTATSDDDNDARAAAATALGQYPRRDVYDTLVAVLDDPNPATARAAHQSLVLLTRRDVGDDPRAWLDHADARATRLLESPDTFTWQPYDPPRAFFASLFYLLPDRRTPPRLPRGYTPPTLTP